MIIEEGGSFDVEPSTAHTELLSKIVERQLAESMTDSKAILLISDTIARFTRWRARLDLL